MMSARFGMALNHFIRHPQRTDIKLHHIGSGENNNRAEASKRRVANPSSDVELAGGFYGVASTPNARK